MTKGHAPSHKQGETSCDALQLWDVAVVEGNTEVASRCPNLAYVLERRISKMKRDEMN